MSFRIRDGLLYLGARILKKFDSRPLPLNTFSPNKIKKILVVSSTAIGDTLISTPAIRALRNRYPEAQIVAHLNYKNLILFKNNPYINKIVPYYGGYHRFFSTIAALRAEKPDAAVILHGNGPQAIPMAYFSGAPYVVRIPNKSDYRFLLSNQEESAANDNDPKSHGIEDRLRISALLDASSDDLRMVLIAEKEAEIAADNYLKSKGFDNAAPLIGFQVSASNLSRMWPADRFVLLGKKLLAKFPSSGIILTGSPQERDYCEKIARSIDDKRVLVSAGDLPLEQVPALIEKFNLLITGDTGIMHIAIAVGTPTLSLFAVADPVKSAACYDKDKHRVIYKGKTCDPCPGKKCKNPVCMEQIEIEEVFDVAVEMLDIE